MNEQPVQKRKKTFVCRILSSPFSYCVLTGLCWCLVFLIDFLGGCRGYHFTLMVFPAGLVPLPFAATFTLTVLVLGILDIVGRRRIILSIMLILVTVGFWFTPRLLKHSPFLLGFKHRVLRLSSPQELRQIASTARTYLSTDNSLPSPEHLFLWDEEVHRQIWEKMPKSKILGSEEHWPLIVINDNGCIELSWGGALTGHWGIRIAEKIVKEDEFDWDYIQIEEDIAVYMSD